MARHSAVRERWHYAGRGPAGPPGNIQECHRWFRHIPNHPGSGVRKIGYCIPVDAFWPGDHGLRAVTEDADGCGFKAHCACGKSFSTYTETVAYAAHEAHQQIQATMKRYGHA